MNDRFYVVPKTNVPDLLGSCTYKLDLLGASVLKYMYHIYRAYAKFKWHLAVHTESIVHQSSLSVYLRTFLRFKREDTVLDHEIEYK